MPKGRVESGGVCVWRLDFVMMPDARILYPYLIQFFFSIYFFIPHSSMMSILSSASMNSCCKKADLPSKTYCFSTTGSKYLYRNTVCASTCLMNVWTYGKWDGKKKRAYNSFIKALTIQRFPFYSLKHSCPILTLTLQSTSVIPEVACCSHPAWEVAHITTVAFECVCEYCVYWEVFVGKRKEKDNSVTRKKRSSIFWMKVLILS